MELSESVLHTLGSQEEAGATAPKFVQLCEQLSLTEKVSSDLESNDLGR